MTEIMKWKPTILNLKKSTTFGIREYRRNSILMKHIDAQSNIIVLINFIVIKYNNILAKIK